jgi:hypothetical protein
MAYMEENSLGPCPNGRLVEGFWRQVIGRSRSMMSVALANTLELIFVSPVKRQRD